MSRYAGTKTEQNLLKSFAGESQARSRYTFFASVAKKERLQCGHSYLRAGRWNAWNYWNHRSHVYWQG